MASKEQLEKVTGLLEDIRKEPVASLLESPKWGSLNFRDVERELTLIAGLVTQLSELPLEYVPDGPLNEIINALTECQSAVRRILQFDLEGSTNPKSDRETFAESAKSASVRLLVATQSWIPFLAYQKGDVQRNIQALSNSVTQAKRILDDAQVHVQTQKHELAGIITAAREASATAGVGVFTSDFAEEVVRLNKIATKWLIATAVAAAITVCVAVISAFTSVGVSPSSAQVVQYISSKLIALFVLITATVWCGRMFKATMHQAATNHHRANALKTFQAFVRAAADDGTRDAVLLETTRSIFAPSPSGYLETTEPAGETGSKLLEVIRTQGKAS